MVVSAVVKNGKVVPLQVMGLPSDSLSLSRFCFRTLRTRLSARVWAAGLTTGSAETRQAFHCAPTGGNVSAGPYSSTAVPMMRSAQCHDGPNEVRTRA